MDEKFEKLQDKVNRLTNIAWVLGTLAGIFGLGSGFGISSILEARKQITELNTKIESLDSSIRSSDQLFVKYREEQQNEFDKYVHNMKEKLVLDDVLQRSIHLINERISRITLVVVDNSEKSFVCGGSSVASPSDMTVMYGSKDGTGCGATNQNYFKTISLKIPSIEQ